MSIRVESDPISSSQSATTRIDQVSKPPEGAAKSRAAASQGQDQIDVSRSTANISAELGIQSSTRAGKLQQLGALYASGQYKVDSAQIGQSIVANAIGGAAKD